MNSFDKGGGENKRITIGDAVGEDVCRSTKRVLSLATKEQGNALKRSLWKERKRRRSMWGQAEHCKEGEAMVPPEKRGLRTTV